MKVIFLKKTMYLSNILINSVMRSVRILKRATLLGELLKKKDNNGIDSEI